ncbi:hypothetical protein ADL22_03085 [Streptomyces sp. NRRL F-4489]|nr:hypothetical protein ADL22_03085 [Streptomyces sp. NRRL F-4489]
MALAGGYVLGRTKKAKLALGLGMYLAGKRLSPDPKQWKQLVADSPLFGQLNDQVRRELVDATKSAATTALTRRMSGLADSLQERTKELGGGEAAESSSRHAAKPAKPAKRTAGKAASGTRKAASGARKTASRKGSGGRGGSDA